MALVTDELQRVHAGVDDVSLHSFPTASGEHKIYVPRKTRLSASENPIPVSDADQAKQAKQLSELVIAAQECYGTGRKVLNIAHLLEEDFQAYSMFGKRSRFSLTAFNAYASNLEASLREIDTLEANKARSRLNSIYNPYGRENHELFVVELVNSTVRGFKDRTSPLRGSAKRINPEWVPIFNAAISNTATWSKGCFNIVETTQLLKETRRYAIEVLASMSVPATDENIISFIQLASIKKSQTMVLVFRHMSCLKPTNRVDKNIAYMIGQGITFGHLLLFAVTETYPKTIETMQDLLSMPESWLVRAMI